MTFLLVCYDVCGLKQSENRNNLVKSQKTNETLVQNAPTNGTSLYKTNITRDENHPLLTVLETEPHAMSLMIRPIVYKPDTMIRLLYERVARDKGPFMLHLDDPVIEYFSLTENPQHHTLSELPMGKYIVCGEAMVMGDVYQANCFETRIERLDNDSLQVGVQVIIVISIVLVVMVIVYAALYQMCKNYKRKKENVEKL